MVRTHSKLSDPCKAVLSSVYGISVETETEDIYPPIVCNSCYLGLRRASLNQDSGPILKVSSWSAHSEESCPVCTTSSGGRPKKRNRGRPSESDEDYIIRNILRKIKSINTPEFAPFPLLKSLFLPSPYIEHLLCKSCHCVPNQPIEVLTCRHYLCTSCINSENLSCPCNGITLLPDQLSSPSELAVGVMGSLLLHCSCSQVIELCHLQSHLKSKCTDIPVPSPSAITVEQLLISADPDKASSLMVTQTQGLLAEKLFSSSGPITCRSSTGKVYN